MYVNTKKLTISSLLLAVTVILIYLGNIFESSTVFFLALASFNAGIEKREYGYRTGFVFCLACLLLGLILIPQKLYMLTFLLFSLYILFSELAWDKVCAMEDMKKRDAVYILARLLIFNVLYLPCVFWQPKMIFSEDLLARMGGFLYPLLILAGQIFLLLFDRAYCYFQAEVWEKIRKNIDK